MRHFSIQLLKESPSPALRTCARLAQLQPFIGRELFAAGFVSCWAQLNEATQRHMVRNLEMAFSSPHIPPEILATLLNLVQILIFVIILNLKCEGYLVQQAIQQ
ncbi:serine/threonine-protein kinase TOR-like, partial [Trifolium medium]|nr:serine/threonine-protein kinase TOR-like [Trifolium medium]